MQLDVRFPQGGVLNISRKPYFLITTSVFVALLLCMLSAWALYRFEEKTIHREFKNDIDERAELIYRELLINFEALQSLTMLFDHDSLANSKRFKTESQAIIDRYQGLLAIEWIPQTSLQLTFPQSLNNITFTKPPAVHAQSSNLAVEQIISTYAAQYRHDLAERQSHYFPYGLNNTFNGKKPRYSQNEHLRSPSHLETLFESISREAPQLTTLIQLPEQRQQHRAVLAFLPVYGDVGSTDGQSGESYFLGMIVGVYNVRAVVQHVVSRDRQQNIDMQLFDVSNNSFTVRALYSDLKTNGFTNSYLSNGGFIYDKLLPPLWGRTWMIKSAPDATYLQERRSHSPYIVLFIGALFIFFFVWYLFSAAKNTEIITRVVAAKTKALSDANIQLQQLSRSDGLTKLANRRTMDEVLDKEWLRAMRSRSTLSFILIDIDYFKQYNDNYGHVMGDECLQQVAAALQQIPKRAGDLIARYGGEEFAIILTDTDNALAVAERCRRKIESLGILHAHSTVKNVVTISVGVCVEVPKRGSTPCMFIERADQALYKAKDNGRNRIYSANEKQLSFA